MKEIRNPHVGHRSRLKERFAKSGLDGFADHEVLELLLTYAIPQKNVNPLAHELVDYYGSLNGVLNAPLQRLVDRPGISEHSATLLSFMPKLAQRYIEDPASKKRVVLNTTRKRIDYFIPKFVDAVNERLYVAFLDSNLSVLGCELITEGISNMVVYEPSQVISRAYKYNATTVVLAHNHMALHYASTEDQISTLELGESLKRCNIFLLDHILVCKGLGMSIVEEQKLARVI